MIITISYNYFSHSVAHLIFALMLSYRDPPSWSLFAFIRIFQGWNLAHSYLRLRSLFCLFDLFFGSNSDCFVLLGMAHSLGYVDFGNSYCRDIDLFHKMRLDQYTHRYWDWWVSYASNPEDNGQPVYNRKEKYLSTGTYCTRTFTYSSGTISRR